MGGKLDKAIKIFDVSQGRLLIFGWLASLNFDGAPFDLFISEPSVLEGYLPFLRLPNFSAT